MHWLRPDAPRQGTKVVWLKHRTNTKLFDRFPFQRRSLVAVITLSYILCHVLFQLLFTIVFVTGASRARGVNEGDASFFRRNAKTCRACTQIIDGLPPVVFTVVLARTKEQCSSTEPMETLAWFMVWGMAPVLSDFVGKSFQKTGVLSKYNNKGGKEVPRRLIHGKLVALEADITDEQIGCMEDCCALADSGGLCRCNHGWFESSYRSAKLHYRKWLPPASPPPTTTDATAPPSPRAVVIFMHGISTHGGKAFVRPPPVGNDGTTTTTTGPTSRLLGVALLAEVLVQHDVAVYAFDQYGHGLSEGARFWIPQSWTTNRDDYITFCRLVSAAHPNVPILYVCYYILGGSFVHCCACGASLALFRRPRPPSCTIAFFSPRSSLITETHTH
jgi:hypothetical protein